MRIAVIGAGGVGTHAARFLAQDGHAVTVLERFALDHDRGSSYGGSRVIRRTYADALYTALMAQSYALWDALERDAGETLFERSGGVFFGRDAMAPVLAALAAHGVPHETLDARTAAARFPQLAFAADECVVFEPGAGWLRASACVRASARLAIAHGATLREHARVTAVDTARASGVRLALEGGGSLEVDRVVLAAGPWASALVPRLAAALTVTRQVYAYLAPHAGDATFDAAAPVWIDFESMHYGFPREPERRGVKLARHVAGAPCEPDGVDRSVHDDDLATLRAYASVRLPRLSSTVLEAKVCLYTMTPDEDFVLDYLPGEPRVVVCAGLSGHGFKFVPLLGRLAADLALDRPVPFALERFAIARLTG